MLIDKDDAIKAVCEACYMYKYIGEHYKECKYYPCDDIKALEAIPSAEQVTGKLKKPCDSLLTGDSDECKEQKSKLESAEAVQDDGKMIPIELKKRYPHSKDEDITDAFMRGYKSAQAVQGWIPCSERMPEELEAVNVTWVNHNPPCYYIDIMNVPFTATGVYHDGKWYWWDATVIDLLGEYGGAYVHGIEPIDKYIEITAWMPLPKPYKGGDDE